MCLEALKASSAPPLECIVVDDGSTDGSGDVAREAGASVIRLDQPGGPARARNRGAREARGDLLLFVDADVCVRPGTLEHLASRFAADPELSALFGSYDDEPGDPAFLSQYRNLMHTFVHQTAREEASTFWCGCGAIRRKIFESTEGFDETIRTSALEDVEFGAGLARAGHKIRLDKEVQVQHRKHWEFLPMIKTDVLRRGIPWMHLILRNRSLPNDMNVDWKSRFSLMFTWALAGVCLAGAAFLREPFVAPLAAVLFLSLGGYWSEKTSRAPGLVITALAAGAIALAAWRAGQMPALILLAAGYLSFLAARRFRPAAALAGLSVALAWAAAIFEWSRLGYEPWFAGGAALLAVLVWLNRSFYRYLASVKGGLFALAAIPFHLLYHFCNGISLVAGLLTYRGRG